jgi:hypothetical protein
MVLNDIMKKTLLALFAGLLLPVLCPVLAHAGCKDRLQMWAGRLHPQRTLDTGLAVCKDWPADSALTLAALPLPHKDNDRDGGVFDLEVLVANRASGAIVAHVFQENAITSDAVRFAGLSLDTARYQLKPGVRAFGVRVSYEGSSRVNPFTETALNLYAVHGRALRPVLDRLIIDTSSGEWDGQCAGEFDKTMRTIGIDPAGAGDYAALRVAEKSVHSVSKQVDDRCASEDGKPSRASVLLPYRDGIYSVPKAMQQSS